MSSIAISIRLHAIVLALFFVVTSAFVSFADEDNDDAEDNKFPVLYYGGSNFSQYTRDAISDTRKFENEFALNLDWGDFEGYFRISNDLTFPNMKKDMEFEKSTLKWNAPWVTLTAGDFSALFAHGLALNVFEAPAIDFDNELRGGMAELDFKGVQLTALSGRYDNSAMLKKDSVDAAHVNIPLGDSASLGATYVDVDDFQGEIRGTINSEITGVNADLDFGSFGFSGELVRYDRDGDNKDGEGYFVTGSYYGKNISVYAGYYDYWKILSPFAVPATMKEHPEQGGASPDDEIGYGLKVTWSPPGMGDIDVNWAQSNVKDGGFPYTETMATWTAPYMESDNLVLQNRYLFEFDVWENNSLVEWQHALNDEWTTLVTTEFTVVDDFSGRRNEYLVGLGVDYMSEYSIDYLYEHAKYKFQQTNRWDKIVLRYDDPAYKYDVQLVLGSQRAGFVCVGGICQLLPAFKGFELTVNLYF